MSASRSVVTNTDIISGAFFVATGVGFLVLGTGYPFGSMLRMGAGFFPVILSSLLTAMGAVILGRGWFRVREQVAIAVSPMARVLGSIALFAFFTQRLGLYPTLPPVVLLAASASDRFRWRPTLLLAIGITVASDLIFRIALGLPLQAIGPWLGG